MNDDSMVTALHVASPAEGSQWMALVVREPDGEIKMVGAEAVISLVTEARTTRAGAPSIVLFAVDTSGGSMLVRAITRGDGGTQAVALGSTPEDAEMRAAAALSALDEA